LLAQFSSELPEHRQTFEQLVRCEQWLAPLEASFEWLCIPVGVCFDASVARAGVDDYRYTAYS